MKSAVLKLVLVGLVALTFAPISCATQETYEEALPSLMCPPADGPPRVADLSAHIVDDHPVIRFDAEVVSGTVDRFISMLHGAEKLHVEYVLVDLNSEGGNVFAGRRMADAIEHARIPVYCLVDSYAASAAFFVLQGCAYRLMVPTGHLLAHEIYEPYIVHANRYALRRHLQETEEDARTFIDFETHRLKITRDEFVARTQGEDKDWVMGADEALRVGAVDAVVLSVKQAASLPAAHPLSVPAPARPR